MDCCDGDGDGQFDYLFKVLLIGDTGVGKSCLLTRFADGTFCERMTATIGVDFRVRTVDVNGKRAKLQVWDSAGQERFRSLTSSYYRGAHAVALVFDLASFDSIHAVVHTWLHELDAHCPPYVRRVLVGNKADLGHCRQVSHQHALDTATRFDMLYIETSAKTAFNVHQAFETIVRDILDSDAHSFLIPTPADRPSLQLGGDDDNIRICQAPSQSHVEQPKSDNKRKCC